MDIKSPAVGKVLRLSVENGAQVERGDELMVIESMKVEIPVKAPAGASWSYE
jgi:biotin carboxyl carrier protein